MQMSTKGLVSMHLHMCVHRTVSSPACIHTTRSTKIDSVQLSEGGVSSTQQGSIKVFLENNS